MFNLYMGLAAIPSAGLGKKEINNNGSISLKQVYRVTVADVYIGIGKYRNRVAGFKTFN